AFLQEDCRLADQILLDGDLVEGLVVHEGVLAALLEEELILLLVELDPLDDIGRTDALVQLGAVADVPELHLKIGAPVSHLDDMNLGRPHQAALILQYVAGPDFVAVDLHRGDLARKKAARKLTAWPGPRNRGPGEERPQASAVPSPRTRSIARADWRHKA